MSSCELTLTLDRADQTYHFGDVVSGTVEARVASACHCRVLVAELEWRTHGRGNRDLGWEGGLMLFEGTWQPGQFYRYPFRFTAPNGPATYHGHLLNVDWYVRASADLPWFRKAKVEREMLLLPPEPSAEADAGSDAKPTERATVTFNLGPSYQAPSGNEISDHIVAGEHKLVGGLFLLMLGLGLLSHAVLPASLWVWPLAASGALLIAGVPFVLVAMRYFGFAAAELDYPKVFSLNLMAAALLVVVGLSLKSGGSNWLGPGTILGGPALVLLALYLIARAVSQRKLGAFAIEIRPAMVRRGGPITLSIHFHASQTDTLPSVLVTMSGQEIVTSGSGSDAKTDKQVLWEKSFPLAAARASGSGPMVALEALLTVPADAPFTFASNSNKLSWEVAVRVSAAGSPDWARSYPVTVCP